MHGVLESYKITRVLRKYARAGGGLASLAPRRGGRGRVPQSVRARAAPLVSKSKADKLFG